MYGNELKGPPSFRRVEGYVADTEIFNGDFCLLSSSSSGEVYLTLFFIKRRLFERSGEQSTLIEELMRLYCKVSVGVGEG